MTEFDPKIIHAFVDKLYKDAANLELSFALAGACAGCGAGVYLASIVGGGIWVIIGLAVVGALMGYVTGNKMAFGKRLHAQITLCQLQIEQNTRK